MMVKIMYAASCELKAIRRVRTWDMFSVRYIWCLNKETVFSLTLFLVFLLLYVCVLFRCSAKNTFVIAFYLYSQNVDLALIVSNKLNTIKGFLIPQQ